MAATGNEKTVDQVIQQKDQKIDRLVVAIRSAHTQACAMRDALKKLKDEDGLRYSMKMALTTLETAANESVATLGPFYSGGAN